MKGLATMVEILSTITTGMKWGDDTQPMYGPKSDPTTPRGIGQFYLVARADGAVALTACRVLCTVVVGGEPLTQAARNAVPSEPRAEAC